MMMLLLLLQVKERKMMIMMITISSSANTSSSSILFSIKTKKVFFSYFYSICERGSARAPIPHLFFSFQPTFSTKKKKKNTNTNCVCETTEKPKIKRFGMKKTYDFFLFFFISYFYFV